MLGKLIAKFIELVGITSIYAWGYITAFQLEKDEPFEHKLVPFLLCAVAGLLVSQFKDRVTSNLSKGGLQPQVQMAVSVAAGVSGLTATLACMYFYPNHLTATTGLIALGVLLAVQAAGAIVAGVAKSKAVISEAPPAPKIEDVD